MYEDTTYEVILERMLARISDKFDKREGSIIWDTHSPTAIELQILYLELDNIIQEAFGDTASREYLILRCAERGITPYDATNAILQGVFTPANIDVLGQRFNIGELNYVVTEKISDGVYKVMCETPGIIGNQYLGTMTPIDYIDGLETAELVAVLIPGEDEEDTEDLRARYFESFGVKAYCGNIQEYIENVTSISGVGGCKVTRTWNSDITPSDLVPDDTVSTWVESVMPGLGLNSNVTDWINNVYTVAKDDKLTIGGAVLVTIINSDYEAASDALVEEVQETLDPVDQHGEGEGLAPIGHVVHVQSVEEVSLEVEAHITFVSGYDWDSMEDTITSAVNDYFYEIRKDWASSDNLEVLISQIESHILNITGIYDVSATINGSSDNYTLNANQIPILGGISSD